jgi:hypothetical protein
MTTTMNNTSYPDFLEQRRQLRPASGFEPLWLPDCLKDFQRFFDDWAIRQGRCLLSEDCGLGKSLQELVWSENVLRKTNKPVLIVAPLAVTHQFVTDGEKFGIEVHRVAKGKLIKGINVVNYQQLHHCDPAEVGGVSYDESSCAKHFKGYTQQATTEFSRRLPYRLLATATAAPNDFIELGTQSEILGELGFQDMLTMFFTEDTVKDYLGWGRKTYRFRGHAEQPFWRWVCSWARAMRKPSDYGFDDTGYILPPLTVSEHVVNASRPRNGMLFAMPSKGLAEQREERRMTIKDRCEYAANLVANTGKQAIIWCHLNPEGELLDKIISDGVEVAGRHSDEVKEERLMAFARGDVRILITKQKIAGWGLNLQNCAHVVTFPSHSWEAYYQSVRRCYRFGQQHPVQVDIVTTEGEQAVTANLQRKSDQCDQMFNMLIQEMGNELKIERAREFTEETKIPSWLMAN